jgi:colanic acid/amylovoran biosynthesis glycosyltransferase
MDRPVNQCREVFQPAMKVLIIVPSFPKLSETFIVSKFLGLLERGTDVHVLCARSEPAEWTHFPALMAHPQIRKRVHVSWRTEPKVLPVMLFIPALISCLILKPLETIQYLIRGFKEQGVPVFKQFYLDREILIVKPDIVHFEFGALAVGKEYLRHRLNSQLVTSFRGHDIDYVGIDLPDFYAKLWQNVDAVHFLGRALKRKALDRGFRESIPHAIIPPAIDIKKFNASHRTTDNTTKEKIRILSLGRLHWAKGYEYALQALHALHLQGVQFEYHIAGGGEALTSLAFSCHQLKMSEFVTFLGSVPPQRVHEELKWADIYLHPAVEEGFGNAVIEAQAMELPVVCSDAVGLPENVEDRITGFVVPVRDPIALADKITILARDPELRERMGKAGRQRVTRYFRVEDQICAWENFYRKVAQGLDL